MKKRVLLRVAYDGTNYHGWQVQPGAVTIEQVLNEKLTDLLGEPIEVIGASRTDSGVHAMGNAVGLTIVAIVPILASGLLDVSRISFSGTSLIIIVGVVLETIKAVESQMLVRYYKGFLND